MGWSGLGWGRGGVADSNKPILGEFLPSDQSLKNRLSAATLSEQNGHILESISFIWTKKGERFLCVLGPLPYILLFLCGSSLHPPFWSSRNCGRISYHVLTPVIHIYVQHLLSALQPLPSLGKAHFLFKIIPHSPPAWIDYSRRHSVSPISFLARRSVIRRAGRTGEVSLVNKTAAE